MIRMLPQPLLAKKNALIRWLLIIAVGAALVYYDTVYDAVILMIFLLASYSLGSIVRVRLSLVARVLVQVSIGMGLFGFVMHCILLAGVGSKTLYLIILLVPIFARSAKIRETGKELLDIYHNTQSKVTFSFIAICIFIIIVAGNTTVRWADALAKYLSVVTYAAENGAWKTNIVESIIYADQFTMYCSLATIGVALGANRFFIWIASICMCVSLLLILEFSRTIYQRTNTVIVTAIYFTTPYFLKLGMDMCIDFAQVVFLLAAILCMADIEPATIWDNLYAICVLCGCAIFAKLTASYVVLAIGVPVIIAIGVFAVKNKVAVRTVLAKVFAAGGCLIGGLIVPVVYGFYLMGTPVAPWLNEVFKSPYVAQGNFVDPYQNSVYGLNFDTLRKIIFHTSSNTEMADGAMGIWLFGLLLIPLGIALYRKKAYFFWSILSIIMFELATLFTYNLRYYIAIMVLFLTLVCIALSIIVNKLFPKKWAQNIAIAVLVFFAAMPNLYMLNKMAFKPLIIKPTDVLCEATTPQLLKKYISEDSWVFANSNMCDRGDWTGVLYTNSWYNTYLLLQMEEDHVSYADFLQAFDYVVLREDSIYRQYISEEFAQILASAGKPDSLLEKYVENEDIVIYKVRDIYSKQICEYSEEESMEITESTPFIHRWDDLASERYNISADVTNTSEEIVTINYMICYYDEENNLMSYERIWDTLETGEQHIESAAIKGNSDAAYAIFSFAVWPQGTLLLDGLYLEGYQDRSYINNLVKGYYERTTLK